MANCIVGRVPRLLSLSPPDDHVGARKSIDTAGRVRPCGVSVYDPLTSDWHLWYHMSTVYNMKRLMMWGRVALYIGTGCPYGLPWDISMWLSLGAILAGSKKLDVENNV
ncbi:hypothetical protein PCH_Pc21g10290 [Penicillium rubens Wisconsin 54-1255]|uniref:Uncharacterized protein n=1 Tax=Penicillium rubens (strain ATCC 28089 / DSM 1075 / NRRL 1951 / Wisconsin 54-1255) TaxID=500485 RepID=B6HIH6_PENRW|nr:hypothetical protein PCH_Pc21g10290 [Penicillium rubens Wisconsin 54-1255]